MLCVRELKELLPIVQALVAEITTVGTSHSALAVRELVQSTDASTRNLGIGQKHAKLTPARAFLQHPHFTALTVFLL